MNIYHQPAKLIKQLKPASFGLQRLLSTEHVQRKEIPSRAEVVIAGAGAVGSSIAYHLTKCGWKDILLLEQGQAGCGTSWHAAGLCGTIRGTRFQTQLALYANDLYTKLEAETGVATGFKQCGSLNLASSKDRAISYQRLAVLARECGVECHEVGPKEAFALNPFIDPTDVEMALWVPNDGLLDPSNLVQAYVKGATQGGATTFFDGAGVLNVECEGTHVTGVSTARGHVNCDLFINACGLWARELGQRSSPPVAVPLHACEHYYVVTKPIEGMNPMLPVTRDYDYYTYLREWSGGLMGGGFEPNARGTFFRQIPDNFEFQLLEGDWDQFQIILDGLIHRYPCFSTAEIRQLTNGPESFTPDGHPYISRSLELSNYYIAAGLNSNGIINSAGVGKALAEIITYGESEIDISSLDVRRIHQGSNNKRYCHDKAASTLAGMYEMVYPVSLLDGVTPLNSPLHWLLHQNEAVWGKHSGWARPLFFKLRSEEKHIESFGRPSWISNVQAELRSMTESVGMIDLSSTSKFSLTSSNKDGLLNLLRSLCPHGDFNAMQVGDMVGTVAVDDSRKSSSSLHVDVLKVDANTFMLIAGAEYHTLLSSCLRHKLMNSDIILDDVTGRYASIGLIGPKSEELLNDLLSPPFTTSDMTSGDSKVVDIGYATSVILSKYLTKVENGWQLLIPAQNSQNLYTMLMKEGQKHNIRNIGSIALNSFRIQNPPSQRGQGGKSVFRVAIDVVDERNWPWGGEPVLDGGKIVGTLSCVGYCEEANRVLGLASCHDNELMGESLTVQIGQDSCMAKVF